MDGARGNSISAGSVGRRRVVVKVAWVASWLDLETSVDMVMPFAAAAKCSANAVGFCGRQEEVRMCPQPTITKESPLAMISGHQLNAARSLRRFLHHYGYSDCYYDCWQGDRLLQCLSTELLQSCPNSAVPYSVRWRASYFEKTSSQRKAFRDSMIAVLHVATTWRKSLWHGLPYAILWLCPRS